VLTAAVARGVRRGMVVADMPFMSFQVSPEEALSNAGRFVKEARAEAVKLEGGRRTVPAIERIVDAGIPVMGHLGLTPQSRLQLGGYRIQGREHEEAQAILEDAQAIADAGVFSMVLEGIPWTLAREITDRVAVPTIGIGAGEHCDGQILVLHDMIGFSDVELSFVKRYVNLEEKLGDAVSAYCRDVREGVFPAEEHRFEDMASAKSRQKRGGAS